MVSVAHAPSSASIGGRRMRIGLIAVRAANSSQSWRGVLRAMAQALEEAGADVTIIEIGDGLIGRIFRVKEYIVRKIIKRRYQRHREPMMLRAYGRAMDKALAEHRIDVAISLKAIPMSQSRTNIPVLLYNDSPFSGLLNFYAEFTGMSAGHVAHGHAMERGAARKASYSIYTSQWAADLAIRDYDVDPKSVRVVPIGASLDVSHDKNDVDEYIARRSMSPTWQFLWLGVDWQRKRGALAVQIIEELRRRGFHVHLTVAGAGPSQQPVSNADVTYISFLQAAGIVEHLKDTHFLIFPTLADCTPIVYSEANAFGVPVLSTDVGGIASSLTDGVNGVLFDVDAPVSVWADRIAQFLDGRESYVAMAEASYRMYETRLNWQVAAARILEVAYEAVTG